MRNNRQGVRAPVDVLAVDRLAEFHGARGGETSSFAAVSESGVDHVSGLFAEFPTYGLVSVASAVDDALDHVAG
jgi:hypothetical protein